jgi:hypothetical protein
MSRSCDSVRVLGSAMALALGTATPVWAGGITERVSLGSGSLQAKGDSVTPALSADGRFVAFDSGASNLVRGDTNQRSDVFVRTLAP